MALMLKRKRQQRAARALARMLVDLDRVAGEARPGRKRPPARVAVATLR
jgi:hypothetical protein